MVRIETALLFVLCFCASCSQGMFEILDRSTSDPASEIPRIESFVESNTILVSWSRDEGTDEYILERAFDAETLVYEVVYRGELTSYEDPNLPDQGMYIYRLSKRRGEKTFGPFDPALGVSSLVTRDIYEPNDTEEQAVFLGDTKLTANQFCFRAYNGLMIADDDWYYVDILPKWEVSIVVVDSKKPAGTDDCHFKLYIKDMPPENIKHETAFHIANNDTMPWRCYFKIFPHTDIFVPYGMSGAVGGDIVSYTIRIESTRMIGG
ncbi:hypothetical protein LJC14_00485 [Treponema sp. OttesenSCG-928-L16]|nr:hypothetical protein [Treponema sp. OttesenSCG-928-L16]